MPCVVSQLARHPLTVFVAVFGGIVLLDAGFDGHDQVGAAISGAIGAVLGYALAGRARQRRERGRSTGST